MRKFLVMVLSLAMLATALCPVHFAFAEDIVPDADIIIVGAGGAGIIAAMKAVDAGASVLLIEKTSNAGGNTNRASGGVDAAGTALQKAAGIEDSPEQFAQDMLRVGGNNDMELVEYFTSQGQAAIEFCESIGFEFSPIIQIQYSDPPRSHRDAENRSVGLVLVPLLLKELEARNIDILYNTRATELIQNDAGDVIGVKATTPEGETQYYSNAVILATGGFEGSQELLAQYAPQYVGYGTTGQATNTGDGMLMAEAIGAELINMSAVSAVNVERATGTAPGVTVMRNGGITFNSAGGLTAIDGILEDGIYYMVYNQDTYDSSPTLSTYSVNGVAYMADTLEELAACLNIDPDAMVASMKVYDAAYQNGAYENGTAITANINIAEHGPYYALDYTSAIHYTCGGIRINVNTEVLKADGSVIPGLYAAGEVTGGLHGSSRYTGSSITDVIVFGQQAGQVASAYALSKGHIEAAQREQSAAAQLAPGVLKDGVYSASGVGMQGPLTLTATVSDGNIVLVDYEGDETEVLFDAVEREIINKVIATQSIEGIDTVTGATFASNAVLSALSDIMEQAK